jgi:hypothetical protein
VDGRGDKQTIAFTSDSVNKKRESVCMVAPLELARRLLSFFLFLSTVANCKKHVSSSVLFVAESDRGRNSDR